MTPDEKASLEILITRNAEAVKSESRKIQEALDLKNIETVTNALTMGLSVEQSAKLANVSADFVKSFQRQISSN